MKVVFKNSSYEEKSVIFFFKKNVYINYSLGFVLLEIFGIGYILAATICDKFGLSLKVPIGDIPKYILDLVELYLKSDCLLLEYDQIEKENFRIRSYLDAKVYRGLRLKQGLPLYGQRTHTNAKTCKIVNLSKYRRVLKLRRDI